MAATSTAPVARLALFNLFAAAPGLSGVQVSYSHPGDAMETDTVYLGDIRGRSAPATIKAGRRTRDESYTVDVWVETTVDGPSAQGASERAWTLAAAVEDVVAADASLGLPPPFRAFLGDMDERIGLDEDRRGWASKIRMSIDCQMRLI